ncbi:MAG: diguanylate cyclase [Pseudomonadota bacterium]
MLDEANRWKAQYLNTLDEMESRERLWGELQEQFRQAIARVAIIGYGLDPGIDQRLDKLRISLRTGIAFPQIDPMVREVSDAAARIQETDHNTCKDTARICIQLLDIVPLPKVLQPRAHKLRKHLVGIDRKSQLPNLIEEMTDLLKQAAQDTVSANSETGGLLNRLFGRREKHVAVLATPPGKSSAAMPLVDSPETSYPALTEEALADPVEPADSRGLPTHEVLLQLLERVNFPGEMSGQVEAFKSQLTEGLDAQRLRQVLETAAQLVGDVRHRLLREKQQLGEFLKTLTERIQQMGRHMVEAEMSQVESLEQGLEMKKSFHQQLSTMRQEVTGAANLAQIRRSVESGLDSVERHMTTFMQREEARSHGSAERIRALNERLRGMEGDASQLREQIRLERAQAVRDPLTGLFNRIAYDERLAMEFQRVKRYGTPLSLVVLDIDCFKRVNDTYGHQAGDKVLKTIATRIAANVREADFVCRFGGEEFVSLMPETALGSALQMADKVRGTVESCAFRFHGKPVPITISCGVAEFHPGDTPETVFERAGQALYRAKQTGRNRCCQEAVPAPAA